MACPKLGSRTEPSCIPGSRRFSQLWCHCSHGRKNPCPFLCCGLSFCSSLWLSIEKCLQSHWSRSLVCWGLELHLYSQQLWVTRFSLGTEVEERKSGREQKFRSLGRLSRHKRRDFIVLYCGDVGVQDKGPESLHCSFGLSRMQEIGLIILDSCGKSWFCQLNFSCNLSNHDWWANQNYPQKPFFQRHEILPVRR